MSDPEVPQPEQSHDVDDVLDSAKAGLADAAAAGADVPASADGAGGVDPDLAAFEAAEQDFPGTFGLPEGTPAAPDGISGDDVAAQSRVTADADSDLGAPAPATSEPVVVSEPVREHAAASEQIEPAADTVADTAYAAPAHAETIVVPSEPIAAEHSGAAPVAPAPLPQPIFVQAPEPPRERGNRGTAGAIGLLAAIVFAVLFLGAHIAIGAIEGSVTGENIVDALLAPLTAWGFWVPVATFFIGFWLLGAIINRARWGYWVVFGLVVGLISWGGVILGALFEAPFWAIGSSQGLEIAGETLFSPLAVIAFIIGRELTVWFGAWVARSGARKTELNAEAQREYERTLEAGPTLSR